MGPEPAIILLQPKGSIPEIAPLLMAGGTGTRLWPLSRKLYPKQFLSMHPRGGTPFQAALKLAARIADPEKVRVVTAHDQRFLAAQQVRETELPVARPIWTEPVQRNTAAVAALATVLADSPEEIALLMPSDHYIADEAAAIEAFNTGAELARQGALVVFGVRPTTPETGLGYIEIDPEDADSWRVLSFHEKPDAPTAEQFQQSGRHLWNSGIFMCRTDRLRAQLSQFAPKVLEGTRKAFATANKQEDFAALPETEWGPLPSIPFDKAVAEKSSDLSAVRFDVGWSDLGTFDRLWETGESDPQGNVIRGNAIAIQTRNSLLHAHNERLLAVLGLENMAVVDSGDALLVAPISMSQEMREMVTKISVRYSELLDTHVEVFRPWGSFINLDKGPNYLCKKLRVNPGGSLSLQFHRHRSEHWVVVSGRAEVTLGDEVKEVLPNESVYIPRGTVHSLHNPEAEILELIEVQTGSQLSEDDIVRLSDYYNRTDLSAETAKTSESEDCTLSPMPASKQRGESG